MRAQLARPRNVAVHDVEHQRLALRRRMRRHSGEALIEDRAERVDVRARPDRARVRELLGRHVADRADQHAALGAFSAQVFGHAEIEDHGAVAAVGAKRQEHVGGLQVAVHEPCAVEGSEPAASVDAHRDGALERQRSVAVQPRSQVRAHEALHHQVTAAIVELAAVEHRDQVLARQARQHPRLAPQSSQRARLIRHVATQQLQCEALTEPQMLGVEDLAHAAAADRRQQLVRSGHHYAGVPSPPDFER